MQLSEILSHVDHTLLRQDAVWEEVRQIVEDGIAFRTASVCIPPSFVKQAADYAGGRVKICTVIGFPNGYSTTAVKCAEAADAVQNGADEIDMVVNLGWVKSGEDDRVLAELRAVKAACAGKALKVIIETCLLTREEKLRMCGAVSQAGADFIKTSTGFSSGGATFEDVKLLRENCPPTVQVKAAGGISTIADAEQFLALGASRLGTSRLVALAKQEVRHG